MAKTATGLGWQQNDSDGVNINNKTTVSLLWIHGDGIRLAPFISSRRRIVAASAMVVCVRRI
jgi:hypothetical protein